MHIPCVYAPILFAYRLCNSCQSLHIRIYVAIRQCLFGILQVYVGLFFKYTGLICKYVGLFCKYVGVLHTYISALSCAYMQIPCVYAQILFAHRKCNSSQSLHIVETGKFLHKASFYTNKPAYTQKPYISAKETFAYIRDVM